jgi:transketolase
MTMTQKDLKLNEELFAKSEADITQEPLRQGFGEGLLEAGTANEDVVALCADLTGSTKMNLFADAFPERFFEAGIAEQSMASVASGLAAMGKIPFIASYAMFSPGRNWEQIRTTICYNNVPVKIAGAHAGVSVGPDGGTHQAIEDIAIMRVIPRMNVVVPCDSVEAKKATLLAAEVDEPFYIRCAREATPIMTTEDTPFELGKAEVFFRPDGEADVGVIAAGPILYNALQAAKELDDEGIRVRVMNMATIKPLDKDAVIELAKQTGRIVTVEEHQVAGGLGSAVAEVLAEHHPTPQRFVGVHDTFGESGEPEELIKRHGLDKDSIKKVIRKLVGKS